VCFEVKPKAGFLPSSRHIARAHAAKLRLPRFQLHQLLKHLQARERARVRVNAGGVTRALSGAPPTAHANSALQTAHARTRPCARRRPARAR
jgi:hypothetical protein